MPSTYSPNLRIELIANGEQSGTWGTTTNTNLGTLIEDAIAGYVSVSITSADQALTANNGSADQSRNMVLNLTTTTTAPFNVYIPPAEKFYVVRNASAYNATIYCSTVLGNTTAAGLGVTVLANSTTIIFSDGTNVRVAIDSFSASSLVATNLTVNGNSTLGDTSSDTITLNGTVQPGVVISGSSSGDALRITQTGAGNAFVVEDSANPDATPFVVDSGGSVIRGYTTSVATVSHTGAAATPSIQNHGLSVSGSSYGSFTWVASAVGPNFVFSKSRGASAGTQAVVASGDLMGGLTFAGDDGAAFVTGASITALVDGTPGTNDMPGRLVFSTTADGASTPTERMRISNDGSVAIGVASSGTFGLRIGRNATGGTSFNGQLIQQTIQSDVTSRYTGIYSNPSTAAAAFTLTTLEHFRTDGVTIGSGSAVTTQYGFHASSALTGATNNYGFYSNIASGTGRWNFYANGTADNYFAGNVGIGTSSPTAGVAYSANQRVLAVAGSAAAAANSYGSLSLHNNRATATTADFIGSVDFLSASDTSPLKAQIYGQLTGSGGVTGGFGANLIFATRADNNASISERLRIDSSGNVGIGTSSPSAPLDVNGNVAITGSARRITGDFSNATLANRVMFQTSSAGSNSVISAIPNGAGTQASFVALGNSTPTNASYIQMLANGATDTRIISSYYGTGTYLPMTFYTGGSERMRIDTSGNVGIGTSSPSGKLDVTGSVGTVRVETTGNKISFTRNGANYISAAGGSSVSLNYDAPVHNFNSGDGATTRMTLNDSGNVGIGTSSPSGILHTYKSNAVNYFESPGVSSVALQFVTNNVNRYRIGIPSGSNDLQFLAGGTTETMRLDSSGNVGIGTSSPAFGVGSGIEIERSGSTATLRLQRITSSTSSVELRADASSCYLETRDSTPLIFGINATERARITSGGDFLVATTDAALTSGVGQKIVYSATAPKIAIVGSASTNASTAYALYSTGAGAYRFYVDYSGTISATTTTITGISDVRLKENIRDLDDGLDAVMLLKPRKFDWKEGKGANTKDARGFIAQEFEQVFPDMIEQWMDEPPEGEEPYKAVNANLIPTLVKAIQELKAELDATKAKVAALENA